MGCGASSYGPDLVAKYEEEELTADEEAEKVDVANRQVVVCYIGHLLLNDDKFRGMLEEMVS